MQLSKKTKTFPQYFAPFLKFTSNFERFWKKDDTHSFELMVNKVNW